MENRLTQTRESQQRTGGRTPILMLLEPAGGTWPRDLGRVTHAAWHVGIHLNASAYRRIASDLQMRGARRPGALVVAHEPPVPTHMRTCPYLPISEAFRGSRPRNCIQLQARPPEDHPGRLLHLFQRMSLSRALSRCTIISRRCFSCRCHATTRPQCRSLAKLRPARAAAPSAASAFVSDVPECS